MKKEICIVVGIGAILVVISILFIVVLRDKIAGIALPEASKNYYIQYIVKTPEGEIIPTTIDYVTNNGKLFSFSYSMSAVITSTIFLFFGRWIYKMIFNKGVQVDLTRILRMIEIVVLILGIFTFTSKINPDNNIEKYMIQSDVSDYLNIDRSHFFKIFKKDMMISPQDFIINYKIKQSCDLLRKSSYSISEISSLVGFSSPSYFSRIFKKNMNMTPIEYKNLFVK